MEDHCFTISFRNKEKHVICPLDFLWHSKGKQRLYLLLNLTIFQVSGPSHQSPPSRKARFQMHNTIIFSPSRETTPLIRPLFHCRSVGQGLLYLPKNLRNVSFFSPQFLLGFFSAQIKKKFTLRMRLLVLTRICQCQSLSGFRPIEVHYNLEKIFVY